MDFEPDFAFEQNKNNSTTPQLKFEEKEDKYRINNVYSATFSQFKKDYKAHNKVLIILDIMFTGMLGILGASIVASGSLMASLPLFFITMGLITFLIINITKRLRNFLQDDDELLKDFKGNILAGKYTLNS